MPLSDTAIRTAKSQDRPYKMADSGGLFLQVTPAGGKLWRMKYRMLGKEKLLSFGAYPAVMLADARERRDAAKRLLATGIDPAADKKAQKLAAIETASQTFGLLAREYIAKLDAEKRAPATMTKNRWLLEDLAAPLASCPITAITAPEILQVLRKVEARGAHESARRLRAAIGRVFRFAMATGRASTDPTIALGGALVAPVVRHRAAITKTEQVGPLMRAIDGLEGSVAVRAALKILAYCFPRPGELRLAEWSEIDLDWARWLVPAVRTKMRRPHVIPLAPQAVAIIRDLHRVTGKGRLVFPGIRNGNLPLSENTLNVALRRLGYEADEMSAHGFRTMASTLLNESGLWHPDAIERALAHQDANAVRRAYARGEYWDERVRMAAWWADHLDALKATKTR